MLISELKEIITIIKFMLTELVQDNVLTVEESKIIAPIIIDNCIKHEYIEIETEE